MEFAGAGFELSEDQSHFEKPSTLAEFSEMTVGQMFQVLEKMDEQSDIKDKKIRIWVENYSDNALYLEGRRLAAVTLDVHNDEVCLVASYDKNTEGDEE